jgi:hypothetical protein
VYVCVCEERRFCMHGWYHVQIGGFPHTRLKREHLQVVVYRDPREICFAERAKIIAPPREGCHHTLRTIDPLLNRRRRAIPRGATRSFFQALPETLVPT